MKRFQRDKIIMKYKTKKYIQNVKKEIHSTNGMGYYIRKSIANKRERVNGRFTKKKLL